MTGIGKLGGKITPVLAETRSKAEERTPERTLAKVCMCYGGLWKQIKSLHSAMLALGAEGTRPKLNSLYHTRFPFRPCLSG